MTIFYPTVAGRATTQLTVSRLLFQIHKDQSAIQDLQDQLSSGRRIQRPSDDPAAAIRALTAQRELEFKDQTASNLQSADTILTGTESTLAQAQTIINEMKGVSVSAANSTLSDDERGAMLSQVNAAIDKLVALGNTKFRDQYIFGGASVTDAPLRFTGEAIRFDGDEQELLTYADQATTLAANVSAQQALGVRSEKVVGDVDLNPAIDASTPLALLNRGEGVRPGAISVSNGTDRVEVDLSSAFNIQDVLDSLEGIELAGRQVEVALTSSGFLVRYADGLVGQLSISEVGAGNMAVDLGFLESTSSGSIAGRDLDPRADGNTRISQLLGGVGIPSTESFRIYQGTKSYAISLTNVETVEDLFNEIQLSGAQVAARLDSSGRFISLQSTESGTTMSIGENGGGLASQLGIRTMDSDTRLTELNFGQGIFANEGQPDLIITRTDGSEMEVNLDGTITIGDVIARINNHVQNFSAGLRVTASLASVGNGLNLSAPAGAQAISVRDAGGSNAAHGLGLVAKGQDASAGAPQSGNSVITGADVGGVEVAGAFTSLIRLQEAISSGSVEDLERIAAALDDDVERLSTSRAIVGARQQTIQSMSDLTAEQQIQLKQVESDQLDADLAQVISDLTAREAALQASLHLMGTASRLTLFDYI